MVVEGTRKNFLNKKFPRGADRKVSGETLCKIVDTFERKHKLKVYWCRSRRSARAKVLELFTIEESQLFVRKKGNYNNHT